MGAPARFASFTTPDAAVSWGVAMFSTRADAEGSNLVQLGGGLDGMLLSSHDSL
jgi:hypothetical protein